MIFSGAVAVRSCKDCGVEYDRVMPASPLFIVVLIGAGTLFSIRPLGAMLGHHWWRFPLAVLANVLVLVIVFGGVDWIEKKLRPIPDVCPKCGREMKKSGGFYDFSFIPAFQEIVGTAIYAMLLVGLRWLS